MATEQQIANARRLRRGSTEAEVRMWARLRGRQIEGAKFVRQFPIGPYIVDFCCRAARLVIEIDGGQHGDDPRDLPRSERIMAAGYLILRFWNNDVLSNATGVMQTIADQIRIARNLEPERTLTPTLSPLGRGSHHAAPR